MAYSFNVSTSIKIVNKQKERAPTNDDIPLVWHDCLNTSLGLHEGHKG